MKKNIFYSILFLFFIFVFIIFYLGLNKPNFYTPKESKRIMSLPDDYVFADSKGYDDIGARIGLMVAPLCIKDLIDSIYNNVLKPYEKNI